MSNLRWYRAPLYVAVLPFLVVMWLTKQIVDAGFDVYNALTGSEL